LTKRTTGSRENIAARVRAAHVAWSRPTAFGAVLVAGAIMAGAGALRSDDAAARTPSPAPPAPAAPRQEPPVAGTPPGAAPVVAETPSDPGITAAGALAFFMDSRDYRSIRELKSVMSAGLRASYDHDPTRFNGRKGHGLCAWDYRAPSPRAAATTATVSVKGLWEDQGEAIELRTETVRLARDGDGLWRVAALDKADSQPLRFRESVNGVTSLRMFLRAWIRRDLEAARPLMTDAFEHRVGSRPGGLEALFAGEPQTRRAAYRILEMVPDGDTRVLAKLRLVGVTPGQPADLDGSAAEITLVHKGPRWLVDEWN
jgi:hypothetical protein